MTLPCDPELLDRIRQTGTLSGQDPDGGFAWHMSFDRPQIAVAIHAGHGVRPESSRSWRCPKPNGCLRRMRPRR